jgi:small subunit ribosomal protein S3e
MRLDNIYIRLLPVIVLINYVRYIITYNFNMYKTRLSTQKKFVADGVFKAEVNQLLQKALFEFGYSGLEVNFTKNFTEVRVLVSKFDELVDPTIQSGIKIKELKGLIEQRYNVANNSDFQVRLTAKRAMHKGVNSQEQCEYLKKRLLMGVPVRTAALSVIRQCISKGAKGCEVIVSGKLRQQRAKSVKFKDGYMIHTGQPRKVFLDISYRHIFLKQGIIGVKVKIMMPHREDALEKGFGIPKPLPDVITFVEEKPKKDENDYYNNRY